jgi:hypothetical protein
MPCINIALALPSRRGSRKRRERTLEQSSGGGGGGGGPRKHIKREKENHPRINLKVPGRR